MVRLKMSIFNSRTNKVYLILSTKLKAPIFFQQFFSHSCSFWEKDARFPFDEAEQIKLIPNWTKNHLSRSSLSANFKNPVRGTNKNLNIISCNVIQQSCNSFIFFTTKKLFVYNLARCQTPIKL